MRNLLFLRENLIAHRGLHYLFRENTLSSFQHAIDMGYIIEFDVRLSKDKEVVIYHDYSLMRLYHDSRLIKDLKMDELRKYHIPTMKEVLDLVSGKVPIIIEVKACHRVLMNKLVMLLDQYKGKFAIQSFFSKVLLYFKKIRPLYIRGYLIYDIKNLTCFFNFFLRKRLLSYTIKPSFIGVNLSSLSFDCIKKLRKKYIIIGYTVHDADEYIRYMGDADNFICDIPKNGIKKQETVPLRTVSQKE